MGHHQSADYLRWKSYYYVVSESSAGSRLRGARGIGSMLTAGPLRRGLASFVAATGARETLGGKPVN